LPEFKDERETVGTGKRREELGEWFMGMDEMGCLVTIAVSTL
jgi:hypothetical protein